MSLLLSTTSSVFFKPFRMTSIVPLGLLEADRVAVESVPIMTAYGFVRFEGELAALASEASIVLVPLESLEIAIGRRSDSLGDASSLRCDSSSTFLG